MIPDLSEIRVPTDFEKQLLLKLLEQPFVGHEELLTQLDSLTVSDIRGEQFSLKLHPIGAPPVATEYRIPVEASYHDDERSKREGLSTHILIHVVGGFLEELEFYKDDSSEISRIPNLDELEILTLPVEG